MDEASRLVSELQDKLAELDHKVWQYRRDMASEFEKYAEDLLRDVPKDISDTVSRTIAESMKRYSSLQPETSAIESCSTGTSLSTMELPTIAPIATPVRRIADDILNEGSPRSPHEREKEFQGLFTPSYLPLLDSTNRNERRSSYPTTPPIEFKEKEKEMPASYVDTGTEVTKSLVSSPATTRPQTPKRRNTDEASIGSDWSDSTVRRSALRRSSTSSKGLSPRRVRFDVAGEEVLPSASPVSSQLVLPTNASDSEEEPASVQIEDTEEEEPAPKRISSSQALRALSRSPLVDDGTEWTTLAAPPDGSASVETTNGFSRDSSDESLTMGSRKSAATFGEVPSKEGNSPNQIAAVPVSTSTTVSRDGPETPSDDEMLDMPPLRRHGSSTSPIIVLPISEAKSPTASTRPATTTWADIESAANEISGQNGDDLKFIENDDDDGLFDFDENTTKATPPPKFIQEEDEEERNSREENENEDEAPEPITPRHVTLSEPLNLSSYSRSPAREIIRPSLAQSSIPINSKTSSGILGSYRNHPFMQPIVSPELHAQVASLGDVTTFVGSLRDGAEMLGGTAGSMSERLMMDEYLERRERENKSGRQNGR